METPNNIDFIANFAERTFECYFDKFMFVLQHGRKKEQIRKLLADAHNYFLQQQNEIAPPPPPPPPQKTKICVTTYFIKCKKL